ncbi:hypothetical protein EZ216_01250 [Ramlibacter humi]|uniref:Uncharacterized protein n=1 Tax=Ramlibacter humi TaxID=2530451 RepID=A0A4Z0CBT0_9BURK|nr:hypothetical protein EZ216_01250 [Ramlibacter humi]
MGSVLAVTVPIYLVMAAGWLATRAGLFAAGRLLLHPLAVSTALRARRVAPGAASCSSGRASPSARTGFPPNRPGPGRPAQLVASCARHSDTHRS